MIVELQLIVFIQIILEWDNNKLIRYGNNYYEYDYNGLRIKKITSNSEIDYIRDGNKLLKEIIPSWNYQKQINAGMLNIYL